MKGNVTMRVFKCPYCNFKAIAYKSSAKRTKKKTFEEFIVSIL